MYFRLKFITKFALCQQILTLFLWQKMYLKSNNVEYNDKLTQHCSSIMLIDEFFNFVTTPFC